MKKYLWLFMVLAVACSAEQPLDVETIEQGLYPGGSGKWDGKERISGYLLRRARASFQSESLSEAAMALVDTLKPTDGPESETFSFHGVHLEMATASCAVSFAVGVVRSGTGSLLGSSFPNSEPRFVVLADPGNTNGQPQDWTYDAQRPISIGDLVLPVSSPNPITQFAHEYRVSFVGSTIAVYFDGQLVGASNTTQAYACLTNPGAGGYVRYGALTILHDPDGTSAHWPNSADVEDIENGGVIFQVFRDPWAFRNGVGTRIAKGTLPSGFTRYKMGTAANEGLSYIDSGCTTERLIGTTDNFQTEGQGDEAQQCD